MNKIMNIDYEFPRTKQKIMVRFRLPMTYSGETSSCCGGNGEWKNTVHYNSQFVHMLRSSKCQRPLLVYTSIGKGECWLDADREDDIVYIVNELKRSGYTDIVIEIKEVGV